METWYFDCCIGGRLSKYLRRTSRVHQIKPAGLRTRRAAFSQDCDDCLWFITSRCCALITRTFLNILGLAAMYGAPT